MDKEEIYVVVADNDKYHGNFYDDGGPLVFEQYTRMADIESVKKRVVQLSGTYGNCRIAKLQFISVNQPTVEPDAEKRAR